MKLSKKALKVLQQMMGEEGSVFLRDLPINEKLACPSTYKSYKTPRYTIPSGKNVNEKTFRELKKAGCIELCIEGGIQQQWHMTKKGKRALKNAGMETRAGELSGSDLQWLMGTGEFSQ